MTAILLDDAKIPHRKNEFELFYGFIQENRFNFIEKKDFITHTSRSKYTQKEFYY